MYKVPEALRSSIRKNTRSIEGVSIDIHELPVPGLHCFIDDEVLEKAAIYAKANGWPAVFLTWGDSPGSTCFENGFCYLLALSVDAASSTSRHYEIEHFLCKLRDDGSEYQEPEAETPCADKDSSRWDDDSFEQGLRYGTAA